MAFPLTGRIEVVWLFIAETTYVYYLVVKLRKGLPRFLALLPLLPLSLLVTWRVPTAVERTVFCGFFMWMLEFKFLLLAWDKGLATDSHALSTFPRFVYACQSSVHIEVDPRLSNYKREEPSSHSLVKETDTRKLNSTSDIGLSKNCRKSEAGVAGKKESQSGGATVEEALAAKCFSWIQMRATSQALPMVILRSLVYYIVATSLLRMVLSWKDVVSESVLDLLLGFVMYFWFLLFLEVAVAIPASIVGTELQPMFNMPILADSLGDFWGRRWNLIVINLLRVSVYEPMLISLTRGKKSTLVDRAISTGATFLVSGLMHELLLFYATRTTPSWEMTIFFVLHGAGTVLERFLKAQYGFRVARFLSRAYTLTFLYFTAYWFWFPPLFRNGLLDGMADLRTFVDGTQGMIWLQSLHHR